MLYLYSIIQRRSNIREKMKEEYFISLKITQTRKLHTLKPNHVLCAAAWLQTKSQRHTTMMFNLKNVYRHFWLNTPTDVSSVYQRCDNISLFWENGATAPFSFIWTNTIHILFLGCRSMGRHLKNYINYVAINGATFTIATTMATNTTKGATKQCQNHYSINSILH